MEIINQTKNIYKKFFLIKKELKNPNLNAYNPFHKNKYTSLPFLFDYIEPILEKHNCLLLQYNIVNEFSNEGITVVTKLIDLDSYEFIEDNLFVKVKDQNPQGYGSALTYTKRYSIFTLLRLVGDEDDDGNISSNTKEKKENPIKEISKELTIAEIQKEIGFNNSHRNHMNQYDLKGKDVIRIFNELYHLMISKKTKWNEVELKDEIDIWLEKNKIAKKEVKHEIKHEPKKEIKPIQEDLI